MKMKQPAFTRALVAVCLVSRLAADPTCPEPSVTYGADTPFLLIARMTIPEDKVADYLKAAEEVDTAVRNSETGMLHHTFDQDPEDPNKFVWSEVYSSDAALLNHLVNPPVGAYLGAHTELCGGLDEKSFTVEIYGTLDDATKAEALKLPVPVKFYDTKFGYNRGGSWKK